MLKGPTLELAKATTGLDDEAIARFHPGMEKLFENIGRVTQVHAIAEVVRSENCFNDVKVGDRLVFDPNLNPEKSTGVMCPKALLPVLVQISAIWEMQAEWADTGKEELPEVVWRNVRCLDPGLEDGGVGGVVYRIRLERTNT